MGTEILAEWAMGRVQSTVPAGRASGARVGGPGVSSAGETEKREKHRGGPGGGRRGKSSAHSKLPPRERGKGGEDAVRPSDPSGAPPQLRPHPQTQPPPQAPPIRCRSQQPHP